MPAGAAKWEGNNSADISQIATPERDREGSPAHTASRSGKIKVKMRTG
jgi:hypothetical protein